jgi:hypothetical protein
MSRVWGGPQCEIEDSPALSRITIVTVMLGG